jgi:hypothetical protein
MHNFGGSRHIHKGMESIFDAHKLYFKVWLMLCDTDTRPNSAAATFCYFVSPGEKSPATSLYYTALCGLHDLVEHLSEHPQDVNANGGYYLRPLVGALAGTHST